ncbi:MULTISPECIES: DUF6117 family protein [unclassified Mesorhizobium]|uniref:DUF6117 family protein n=2 Tax=unclassified Mesorhizobium TaxID=325217 RepID=UPI0032AFD888
MTPPGRMWARKLTSPNSWPVMTRTARPPMRLPHTRSPPDSTVGGVARVARPFLLHYEFTPFAHLADGNPYDAYLPPDPDSANGFLQKSGPDGGI